MNPAPQRERPGDGAVMGARVSLVFLLILALVAAALGIAFRIGQRDDSLSHIRKEGVIHIGYAVEAPYAFVTVDGQATGEEPEVARVIAARLGIARVEWRLTEFNALIEGLKAREFDVVAAGMFVTPERAQQVAFSSPILVVKPGLLVPQGNPHNLHSYSDAVQGQQVRIAVLSGSVEEKQLLKLGMPEARLVHVPDARSGEMLVSRAGVDGLALSAPTLRWAIMSGAAPKTEAAEPFSESTPAAAASLQHVGFAFNQQDQQLCAAWNRELAKYIGSQEHLQLISRYGYTPADVPAHAVPQAKESR